MTRAAIYARVSTARQAERDLSLPDQIAQCRAHCERQGWEVVEVFCEREPPRSTTSGPSFRR
jgi:site-specific DNA recombinase